MKITERFDRAIKSLYEAFHFGELKKQNCKACAVGNMVGGRTEWHVAIYFMRQLGPNIDYHIIQPGYFVPEIKKGLLQIEGTGYSYLQIMNIEELFESSESEFDGLCKIIEYLCGIEGIPNIMDYIKLFETENNKPKHQLS